MSNGNGHRWSKFWWRDHQGDAALRACSLAARGYWMEVLCIMHGATPVGHLLINGRSPSNRQMSAICGCTQKEVRAHTAELEAAGVFSRTPDGTIWCRRMVRDAAESEAGRSWGRTGGNPTLKANANGEAKPGGLTPPNNPKVNEGGSTQKLEAEEESKKGPSVGSPPLAGNRRANGTNPRANETNPRAEGDNLRSTGANPRALGTNPRNAKPIPEDWVPNPKAFALGTGLGLVDAEVLFEADKMRDWARSKAVKGADWDARFNNWLRNEATDRRTRRYLPAKAATTLAAEWGLKSFLTPTFDDDEPEPGRLLS